MNKTLELKFKYKEITSLNNTKNYRIYTKKKKFQNILYIIKKKKKKYYIVTKSRDEKINDIGGKNVSNT